MKLGDTIHIRLAQIVRALDYCALIVILVSLVMMFFKIGKFESAARAGIGLVIFAPVSGMISFAVFSILSKNYRFLAISLVILAIFAAAVLVNL